MQQRPVRKNTYGKDTAYIAEGICGQLRSLQGCTASNNKKQACHRPESGGSGKKDISGCHRQTYVEYLTEAIYPTIDIEQRIYDAIDLLFYWKSPILPS